MFLERILSINFPYYAISVGDLSQVEVKWKFY